jgi:hypothetical protein
MRESNTFTKIFVKNINIKFFREISYFQFSNQIRNHNMKMNATKNSLNIKKNLKKEQININQREI